MAIHDLSEPAPDASSDTRQNDLTDWATWPDERLLDLRLCDLDVKIAGSSLEDRIAQLYQELDGRGLHFHPHFWLSDEWFCPDDVPGIAIPFYLAHPRLAKLAWSATHTTFSPNVCHGGVKTNVIPDAVDVEVDIRTVPGDNEDEVRRHLDKALGGLADEVEVDKLFSKPASVSPIDTPLWHVLGRVVDAHYPGARLLPRMIVGFTDAPYFRDKGAVAYGFGLFSRTLTAEAMAGRFHGNDERIDVESLTLTTQAWLEVCEQFLG